MRRSNIVLLANVGFLQQQNKKTDKIVVPPYHVRFSLSRSLVSGQNVSVVFLFFYVTIRFRKQHCSVHECITAWNISNLHIVFNSTAFHGQTQQRIRTPTNQTHFERSFAVDLVMSFCFVFLFFVVCLFACFVGQFLDGRLQGHRACVCGRRDCVNRASLAM